MIGCIAEVVVVDDVFGCTVGPLVVSVVLALVDMGLGAGSG